MKHGAERRPSKHIIKGGLFLQPLASDDLIYTRETGPLSKQQRPARRGSRALRFSIHRRHSLVLTGTQEGQGPLSRAQPGPYRARLAEATPPLRTAGISPHRPLGLRLCFGSGRQPPPLPLCPWAGAPASYWIYSSCGPAFPTEPGLPVS